MSNCIEGCREVNVWQEGCSSAEAASESCAPGNGEQRFVAAADQQLFQLTAFSYTPGTHSLKVHRNGLLVDPLNITELSSTTFFLKNEAVDIGDIIVANALTNVNSTIAYNISNISVESVSVIDGQLIVPFIFSIDGASIYISGPAADTGRLVESIDYSVDLGNNAITLAESYPAGTLVSIVYNDSAIGGGTASDADITDATSSINTAGKFAGKSVVNSDDFHILVATGSLVTSTWLDQVDGTSITPA